MDENGIRERAEAHAKATVAGDLRTAGEDLTKSGMAGAGAVMKAMPKPLESYEVRSVDLQGDQATAVIAYSGAGDTLEVRSTWEQVEGRPKIVALEPIS